MVRLCMGLILFVVGQVMLVRAQDITEFENDGISLEFQEVATLQRNSILQSLDSLKQLSHSIPLSTDQDSLIYDRLRKTQRIIPLAYNDKIKDYIDRYVSKNYNPYMSKLRGLSQHYFPIFEQVLQENNLPDEIKYISVVESSLDPHLVSRSGAVGLWQFMFGTAKYYDLTMDSHVDERKDPYAASYAASRYFKDAYEEFGDWLLALASYNCGRGAVRRAIERSGLDNPDFWSLSPYLPQETQNYIPKFVAMTYAMKNAETFGIGVAETDFDWKPKVIMVDRSVNLQQIAQAVDLPLETVKQFNPSYKKTIVQASVESPKRLVLPTTEQFNDSLLYAALNNELIPNEVNGSGKQLLAETKTYTVGKGETLGGIANKLGVSVQDLRAWNNLTAKSKITGRTLAIKRDEPVRLASHNTKKTTVTKSSFLAYVVKKGDTLSHIAARHKGVTVSQLKSDNNLSSSSLKIGQKLRIRRS